ncbi:zinc finger (C2H2 type) family protein [Striga asiatica]|uniref:Zinc finger (C2H2 type) family protein n=1 Tax=Striga asiatica TaxID=4170 RepID=A0A5A7PPS5_STRAF|nr:zinc finger (C2H2 type) family protein [Striga asiatica]
MRVKNRVMEKRRIRPPPPTRVRHLHQEPASRRAPLEGERTGIPPTNRLEPIRRIHQTQPEKRETGVRDKPGSRGDRRPGLADAGGGESIEIKAAKVRGSDRVEEGAPGRLSLGSAHARAVWIVRVVRNRPEGSDRAGCSCIVEGVDVPLMKDAGELVMRDGWQAAWLAGLALAVAATRIAEKTRVGGGNGFGTLLLVFLS